MSGDESVDALRARLAVAEETLRSIRAGEVDALVVSTRDGDRVFTLRGAEEPYRVMVEQMSEGAASLSRDRVVLYANRRLAELLETPLPGLVGSPIERFVATEERTALAELFAGDDGGRRNSGEFGFLTAGGSRVVVNLSITPLPAGTSSAWSIVATDISGRVHRDSLLREASEYARSLIEASLDPLVTISAEGKITDLNEATMRLTGLERAALIGTDFSDYCTEPAKARHGYEQAFAKGSVVDYPLTIRRRDGRLTDVLYNATVYRDASGNVLGVFAAARDVTERNRAERSLRSRERQQQAVAELGYLALSNPGFEALLDAATVAVARALDVELVDVLELRSEGDLILRAGIGLDDGLVAHAVVPGGSGSAAGYALLAGDPVIVEDLSAEHRFHAAGLLTDHGGRSGVSVAIGPREQPLGVIEAYATTPHRFSRDDVAFLAAVSNVIGTAIQRAQAEDDARRQAEQQEAILATTRDAFWIYDRVAGILDINDVYCRISGYSREELLGRHILPIEPSMTEPQILERLGRATESGFDRYETVHRAKDGHLFDLEISMAYVRTQDKFVVFAQDVSARKQAEQELKLRAELLGLAHDAVIVREPAESRVTFWNREAQAIYGYSPAEALGQITHDLLATVFPESREAVADALAREGRWDGELRHTRKDGLVIVVASRQSLQRGADGAPVAIIELNSDITERKRAEEELRMLNSELERRVAARTVDLERANRELETFAYSVSHDLRAPLRAVDGFSQALLEDYGEKLGAEGRHDLERVRAGAVRMGKLIDAILQLSRLSRRSVARAPVDVSAMAREVSSELQHGEPDRRVEVEIQDGLFAQADAGLVRQVLQNLLANAYKFTSKTPLPCVRFGAAEPDGVVVYFVADNGAGFDIAHAQRLFLPFHRLHRETEFPGDGIGLATVMRAVRKHGGTIWAHGAVNEGATFYFSLTPGARPPASAAAGADPIPAWQLTESDEER